MLEAQGGLAPSVATRPRDTSTTITRRGASEICSASTATAAWVSSRTTPMSSVPRPSTSSGTGTSRVAAVRGHCPVGGGR